MSSVRKVLIVLLLVGLTGGAAMAANVTFQVNMNFQVDLGNFNPDNDIVVVRGDFNGWAGNDMEVTDAGEGIYTGTFEIAEGTYGYKFVIVGDPEIWEGDPNRDLTVGTDDIVIDVDWFDRLPQVDITNVELLFQVNMEVQILNGNFDPENDMVVVRGNQNAIGNWGGAVAVLQRETGSDVYSAWIQFDNAAVGAAIEYKFVYLTDGDENQANWESSDNRIYVPTGDEEDSDSNGYGEVVTDEVYFSNITPDDILTDDLTVNFLVNARPAFYKLAAPDSSIVDVQSGDVVESIDEVDVAGFFNAWPWGGFTTDHIMVDDGTGIDAAAGDTIYSKAVQFFAGDPRDLIFKFGLNGYDVEAGVGENHVVNLDVAENPYGVYAVFGSRGHLYDAYLGLVSVERDNTPQIPTKFSLDQNYPNPFNPTTTIGFSLPQAGNAVLTLFNVKGEVVSQNNLGHKAAGHYTMTVDGSKLASGTYFYTLEAAGFISTKKMTLLK